MAKNVTKKRNIKIVAATMMAIFSLFVTFTGTFAWFLANRSVDATNDDFEIVNVGNSIDSIAVHDFYGSTADGETFGFSPTANHSISWSGHSGTDDGSFSMGTYSVANPHHPVMFLLGLTGVNTEIKLKTNFPYMAIDKPGGGASQVFETYALLNVPANKIEANDGLYFDVTYDENQGAWHDTNGNGVLDSGEHYVTSRYLYDHASQTFILKWADLGTNDNPLSSVVEGHYVLFTDNPTDGAGTNRTTTGELVVTDGLGNKTTQTKTYVPISSSFDNSASFVTINGNRPTYNDSITLYNGPTAGYSYIGVILDYNTTSIEYIYSYFLGHRYLNNGLDFKCDWRMEI